MVGLALDIGNNMQIIERTSPFTGIKHKMKMDVTLTQIEEWKKGTRPIQEMLPHLSPDEREFLMTGITPEEWENM